MSNFTIEESKSAYGAKIKVIGVGGCGGNMVNRMEQEGIKGIELIAANTDAQDLERSRAHTKIQIGERITKGLGAGMKPEVGKESAEESYEEIKSTLEHSNIVFVASGFGGGTGTGAAPVVAQAAKDVGALTISVVTRPFKFEGRKRGKLADAGLEELKKNSDSIIVIPNDKILSLVDKKVGYSDAFKLSDDVLYRAVSGMSYVILSSGNKEQLGGINIDFADVGTVMNHRGMALLGVGESSGEDAEIEAIKNALESPLLDNVSINGAMGVLVHFHMHPNSCSITNIGEAMSIVEESANEDADIIFGTTLDETVENNTIRVTLIATGFGNEAEVEEDKNLKTLNETQQYMQKERMEKLKKVSGDYEDRGEYLDLPSYIRLQRD